MINKQWFLDNPSIIPPKKNLCMTVFNWYTKIKKLYIQDKLIKFDKELIITIPIINRWIKYGCPERGDKNYKEFINIYI